MTCFITILNIIFQIASIIGIGILVVYTWETYKIRKISEKQLITSFRPYLSYLQDPTNFTVKNPSKNIALNIFLLSKKDGKLTLSKDAEAISAIASGDQYTFTKSEMYIITKEELEKRVPTINKYVDLLMNKSVECIGVVYEDLNGKKLYTIHYGSGDSIDQAGVTGYIDDLK